MVSKTLILLALSSLALAQPRRGGRGRYGWGGRGGRGRPNTTGTSNNTVEAGPSAPVAAVNPSLTVDAASGLNTSTAADVCADCTTTTTMFSTTYTTVTVMPTSSSAVEAAAGSVTPQSETESIDVSSAVVAAMESAMSTPASASSSAPAAPEPTSSTVEPVAAVASPESSVELTTTASVSAAAFYGRPGRGSSDASASTSSAPIVIPTTFATMTSAAAPAATSSSSTQSTDSSSGGKKGLSYNTASLLNAFSNKGMSWAYNWGAGPDGSLPSGVEFVPMCWGLDSVNAWSAAAAKAIAAGSKHVLSFNEPDLNTQSNISPSVAATNHIKYLNPLSGQAQIGSPAITNGAGTSPLMGIDWLNAFFQSCNGQCKVDFIAFHWYDSASNLAYFKKHVQDVIDAAAKHGVNKVWLTEFGASGSDSDVANFIDQANSFLDSTPAVERYAYFMVSDGVLVKGNSLSTLGQAYSS